MGIIYYYKEVNKEETLPMKTPSTSLKQIKCARGYTYNVLKAENYNHKGADRVSFTCRKPRGKVIFNVIGYEDGTFSTAA